VNRHSASRRLCYLHRIIWHISIRCLRRNRCVGSSRHSLVSNCILCSHFTSSVPVTDWWLVVKEEEAVVEIEKRHCHDITKNSATSLQYPMEGNMIVIAHCIYLNITDSNQIPMDTLLMPIFKHLHLILHSARTIPDLCLDLLYLACAIVFLQVLHPRCQSSSSRPYL